MFDHSRCNTAHERDYVSSQIPLDSFYWMTALSHRSHFHQRVAQSNAIYNSPFPSVVSVKPTKIINFKVKATFIVCLQSNMICQPWFTTVQKSSKINTNRWCSCVFTFYNGFPLIALWLDSGINNLYSVGDQNSQERKTSFSFDF